MQRLCRTFARYHILKFFFLASRPHPFFFRLCQRRRSSTRSKNSVLARFFASASEAIAWRLSIALFTVLRENLLGGPGRPRERQCRSQSVRFAWRSFSCLRNSASFDIAREPRAGRAANTSLSFGHGRRHWELAAEAVGSAFPRRD